MLTLHAQYFNHVNQYFTAMDYCVFVISLLLLLCPTESSPSASLLHRISEALNMVKEVIKTMPHGVLK